MKKQIHILEGLMILTIILIFSLLTINFIYTIRKQVFDSSYIWNINFSNLKVSEGSKEGNISLKDDCVSLQVELAEENEYYEFTLDVSNNGTLDAKVGDINLDVKNDRNILNYSLTYLDDKNIQKNDLLRSGETKTIKLKIYYPVQKEKIYDALNLELSFNLNYISIT